MHQCMPAKDLKNLQRWKLSKSERHREGIEQIRVAAEDLIVGGTNGDGMTLARMKRMQILEQQQRRCSAAARLLAKVCH